MDNHVNNQAYGAPFEMQEIIAPSFPEQKFPITDFSEAGFDPSNDKKIIQRAIDACSQAGGGIVVVPAGRWLTGPIHLRSNVHLKFEKSAVVTFSDVFADYLPVVFTRWEGMECYNYSPLIYARDCENIAVSGEGTLIGSGQAWWHWKKLQQSAADELCYAESNNIPVEKRVFGTEEAALRPSFIQPINCKNVLIEGISLRNGPQWTLHPVYCENVIIRNIRINSNGPNTDGLNPDSCTNVLIEDSYFDTGDDCIALNSGMNEDGWRVNKPCQNVVIRNCIMRGGHGGLVIGSAMSGGVKNMYAHDCKITGSNQGIRLKSMRGRGGYVEDIWFENIKIYDVKQEAVQINMYYGYSTVVPKTDMAPTFNNIHVKNVSGAGAGIGIEIVGLPEQLLQKIYLENINLTAKKAMVCKDVQLVDIRNVSVNTSEERSIAFENVKVMNVEDFHIR